MFSLRRCGSLNSSSLLDHVWYPPLVTLCSDRRPAVHCSSQGLNNLFGKQVLCMAWRREEDRNIATVNHGVDFSGSLGETHCALWSLSIALCHPLFQNCFLSHNYLYKRRRIQSICLCFFVFFFFQGSPLISISNNKCE